MATFNGVTGQSTLTEKTVVDDRHPAVIRFKQFKADNGVINAGEIVAVDAGGDIVSYDPLSGTSENTPVGVCVYTTDTTKDSIGSVMVHGSVVKASLLTKGAAAASAEISALETNTIIWAF